MAESERETKLHNFTFWKDECIFDVSSRISLSNVKANRMLYTATLLLIIIFVYIDSFLVLIKEYLLPHKPTYNQQLRKWSSWAQ